MKKLLIIIFVFTTFTAFAQQDAMLNQYMFNKTIVNPAYTGTQKSMSFVAMHREQWVSMPGAPQTSSISLHGPIRKYNMGLGGYIMRDELGPIEDITMMMSYAYYLKFPTVTLSLGIQVGGKYSNFHNNKLNFKDKNEQNYYNGWDKEFIPDANVGVYLYGERFYLGASTKQLINSRRGFVENNGVSTYSKLARHYYAMGGFVFPISDNIMCRPSTLVKYVKNADPQVDMNVSFLIENFVWLGTAYRTGNQVAFLAELLLSDQLGIGYSYDMPLEKFGKYSNGTHEIILSYNFSFFKKRRYSPRYF